MSFPLTTSLETLSNLLVNLKPKDREFAQSLIGYHKSHGKLSAKQQPFVDMLIERATADEPDLFQPAPIEGVPALLGFFHKSKTKNPDVRLLSPGGEEFRLYQAGPKSNYPGAVNIVLMNPECWLGRILKDGTVQPHPKFANTPGFAEIVMTIRQFSKDPAKWAASYGKITGKCCFCYRSLEDGLSTYFGYGPVCAKNFGLPWGAQHMKAEMV